MLGIVPPITITQSIGYETTTSIVEADCGTPNMVRDGAWTHQGSRNHTSLEEDLARTVSPAPGTTSIVPMEVVPGPPLAPAEVQASLMVSALTHHLESGCYGLADMDEIIKRFGQLTAGPLTV
jgi:hypothetical protein